MGDGRAPVEGAVSHTLLGGGRALAGGGRRSRRGPPPSPTTPTPTTPNTPPQPAELALVLLGPDPGAFPALSAAKP